MGRQQQLSLVQPVGVLDKCLREGEKEGVGRAMTEAIFDKQISPAGDDIFTKYQRHPKTSCAYQSCLVPGVCRDGGSNGDSIAHAGRGASAKTVFFLRRNLQSDLANAYEGTCPLSQLRPMHALELCVAYPMHEVGFKNNSTDMVPLIKKYFCSPIKR